MALTSVTLEFSEDDLSDTTPTWTNVTVDCMGIEWWAGIDREGNDPQPGGATIVMRSDHTNGRRWEPDYVAGGFYPNVAYGRRFRLSLGWNVNILTANQSSIETDTTGLTGVANCSIARVTTQEFHGSAALQMTATAGADMDAGVSSGSRRSVDASSQYVGSIYFKPDTTARSVRVVVEWYNAAGASIGSDAGGIVTESVGTWTRASVSAVAPAAAVAARIFGRVLSAGASEVHYIDALQLEKGTASDFIVGGETPYEGLWYITDIAIDYPMGTNYSVVTLTCADGFEVLAMDDLPTMDPVSAGSYDDVVSGDGPWGFWPLSDPSGTKARANIVVVRREATVTPSFTGYRKFKGRRGTLYATKSEAASTSGPAGVYKGTPTLGEPGLILGSSDTAVMFDGSQYVKVPLEDDFDEFGGLRALTLEAWFRYDATQPANGSQIIAGPENASDLSTFALRLESDDSLTFRVRGPNGVAFDANVAAPQGDLHYVAGVFGSNFLNVYLDGDVDGAFAPGAADGPPSLQAGVTGEFVSICRTQTASGGNPDDVTVAKAAIYTYALSAERILAHYNAGANRGYDQETAGNRIDALAQHALWNESGIQTTGRDVQPIFQTGQARLEEIAETAHAEGTRTMFFFNGSGDPVYLGHEWQATSSSYNTTQATLGDQLGEVRYSGFEPRYDNETYNEVTASKLGGDVYTAGAGTPPPRRVHTEFTDVLLVNQNEVESLAEATLDFYEDATLRPVSVTLNGNDPSRLNQILRRDIGHQIRVKKSGDGGTQRIDRVTNIIGKRKALGPDMNLVCTWTLGRGFNALANGGTTGYWQAGVSGFSEAGQTTKAA